MTWHAHAIDGPHSKVSATVLRRVSFPSAPHTKGEGCKSLLYLRVRNKSDVDCFSLPPGSLGAQVSADAVFYVLTHVCLGQGRHAVRLATMKPRGPELARIKQLHDHQKYFVHAC